MNEFLLCKASDRDGKICFVVYDLKKKAVNSYSNDEIVQKIINKEIDNAKLENSVVKITDSKRALAKLTFDENQISTVYYILTEYTSELGSKMYSAVSNTGVIYEFSESLSASFCSDKRIINANLTKKGLHVINVPVFSTALHKSLEHTEVQ